MCPIKLCIILVKQPAGAHFGDDWKSGLIERRLSFFVESESDARVRLRRPHTHPRLDPTCVSARSDDACVTILHFRAVIDGVDTSRRNLDLDASSFLSFLSFPTLIQLVPTRTRRARLPVCARKPLGGQVLFTARTLSRPIVVDGYSRWSRPVDASTERRPPSRLVLVLVLASSSPPFPSSISRARLLALQRGERVRPRG